MSIFKKEKEKKEPKKMGRPTKDKGRVKTVYILERHIEEAKKNNVLLSHMIKGCVERWIEEGHPELFLD